LAERLLSYGDVRRETTLSESTIRWLISEGRFPRPRPLLPGRVVWTESEVGGSRTSTSGGPRKRGAAPVTADKLARTLEGRRNGTGWMARCPAHEDRNASLSISEGNDRRILLHCHAGCRTETILAALGLEPRELFPEAERHHTRPSRREVARYSYTDEKDREIYQVVRFDPKDFRQRRPDGTGGWIWNLDGVRRVLYRLPRVLEKAKAGGVVYVVEGEKDVEALERLGLAATCNPGGAGKWRPEYAETFRGSLGAVMLPDNDSPGRAQARDVAQSVHAAGVPVKVLELPGLPEKGDVSDWLAAGGTKEALLALQKAAPLWEPKARHEADHQVVVRVDTVARDKVEWDWPGRMPRAKLIILDGDPDQGKTTVGVRPRGPQNARRVHAAGGPRGRAMQTCSC